MKKATLCILIVLLFAIAIRLYPTVTTGMPFSTDGWPLIRNTELLIQNTPVPLNSAIFDSYNNFWPANQLFGAALSLITSLPPITAMAYGIPIAASFTILIFYFLVKKLTENNKIALTSALLLAAAFSYTLYTSGVTKEAFASPLYITLILLFLLKHDKKTTFLFSILAVTLALTHHFTSFFATIIITALSIAYYVSKNNKNQQTNSNKSNFLFVVIQASISIIHFGFFASPDFNSTAAISTSNLLSVAAYEIIAFALSLQLVYMVKKFSRLKAFFLFIVGCLVSIEIMFIIINTCTLPGAHLLYALPLIIGLPVAVFGLKGLYQKSPSLLIPLFWLISVLAFACFSVFSNMLGGSGFTWRSMNFLFPPLIILIAIGAHKLQITPKHLKLQRFTKTMAVLLIMSIAALNAYGMYLTVSAEDPSLGYAWLYRPSDYHASAWIATNEINQTVAGDVHVDYLVHQYFNKNVSYTSGLSYLRGDGSSPEILYIYNEMYQPGKGYVVAGVPIPLPANWTDKLSNYNIVYANSEVTIYARR